MCTSVRTLVAFAILLPLQLQAQTNPVPANCDWSVLPPRARMVASQAQLLVEQNKVSSFAFAVALHGQIACEQAFGWADRERKVLATPNTPYAVGSVAKSITGTAVYLLEQRRKIAFTDTPADHNVDVRSFPGTPVTIDELMTMTAGVPHGWQYTSERSFSEREFLKEYAFAAYPANQSFLYSNFSFGILGEIVAHASGQPFAEFVSSELLRPLGMSSSSFEPRPKETSVGYRNGKKVPTYRFAPQAAGGFYSSAHDLALFGLFHLQNSNKVLSTESMRKMHTPPAVDLSHRGYRAGWANIPLGNGELLSLSNGTVSAGSGSILILKQADVVISCVTNTAGDYADDSAFQFADAISEGLLERFDAVRKRVEADESPRPFLSDSQLTGQWKGQVRLGGTEEPLELVIDKQQAALHFRSKNIPLTELHFESGKLMGSGRLVVNLHGAGSSDSIELELELNNGRLIGVIRPVASQAQDGFGLPLQVTLSRFSKTP